MIRLMAIALQQPAASWLTPAQRDAYSAKPKFDALATGVPTVVECATVIDAALNVLATFSEQMAVFTDEAYAEALQNLIQPAQENAYYLTRLPVELRDTLSPDDDQRKALGLTDPMDTDEAESYP